MSTISPLFYQSGVIRKVRAISRKILQGSLILVFATTGIAQAQAQAPLRHEKCIYQSNDGKLYINKDLGLYVRVATSPDADAESWLLESSKTSEYANPMFLDLEGWNTLRSPSAVDSSTKETVFPLQDIIFDLYADGQSPSSRLIFGESRSFKSDGVTFFDQEVDLRFEAKDKISGVKDVYYSLNGAPFVSSGKEPLRVPEEGDYSLRFYAVDNVGNVEDVHAFDFAVDHTAPVTKHQIDGINQNRVLAPDATIILSAADSLSGVDKVFFSVDDGDFEVYQGPIPVSRLKDGGGRITYYSEDKVGNQEDHKFIGTLSSVRDGDDDDEEVFDYYIDRDPPVVEFSFDGDYYESDREYISERTKVVLSAKDDKSGVQKILYSYNSFLTNEEYETPFNPEGDSPVELTFSAIDWVENVAKEKKRGFYIDRTAPESKISFDGPVFRNRDTLFIAGQTKIILEATDDESGVKSVEYRLNGKEQQYSRAFVAGKAGRNVIEWVAKDNVNNQEEQHSLDFIIDEEGPSIHHHFSVEPIGEKVVRDEEYIIYPSNTKIYIGATDDVTGEESLKYSVNGGKMETTIPVADMQPGNYEIDIEAVDALKN
ncbi:MAG: OmpL47-type beta-barrel domain-containing protein, partial [Bacteroidota bacterium]